MTTRIADHEIDPLFLRRWSPRAMSGEALTQETMLQLFEAARWAPSASNGQPWRFSYGLAGTPQFTALFELLVAGNQVWCDRAGALVCVVARRTFEDGKEARLHLLDAGAAWMSIALQGSLLGLAVHGLQGFDAARARTALEVPEDYEVAHMIALGKPGVIDTLPEKYQAIEQPNGRHPVSMLAFEGPLRLPAKA